MVATAAVAQNIVYLKVAREIADFFRSKQCPVVFLKGISLLETAYPDLSERFMADIDVLVPKKYLQLGCQLLLEMGYETPRRTLEFRKLNPGGIPVWIDLHAGLWYFDGKKLWERARPKQPGSPHYWVLDPHDNLLHIVLHSILQDGMISETSLRDAAALLQHEGGNWSWEEFWRRAREEGWIRVATLFLEELAQQNPNLLAAHVARRSTLVARRKFRQKILNPATPSYLRMFWAQDHFLKKFKILCIALFPSAAFLAWRYPRTPSWLRPLVRLGILGWKMCYTKIR